MMPGMVFELVSIRTSSQGGEKMRTNKKGKTSSRSHYLAIVLLSVALLIVPFGCAHRPQVKTPPLPKFTEAELGRITVVSACFEPEFECPHRPMTKGKAAGVGALGGFLGSILGGGMSGNPLGIALGIAISPVVAAGGAIYGAIEGETEKAVKETEEIFNHCLNGLRAQEAMQEKVLSLAREMARCTFVEPERCGPNILDEEIGYGSLKEKGIDTVFEISVLKFGLWGEKSAIDPPLSLVMTVRTRLIRVNEDTVLSNHTFRYKSTEKRKFTEWAKNGAQPLREELDRCFGSLAEGIIADLFIN
jgi:hypothetical protein